LAPAENLAALANRVVTYFIVSGASWARGKGLISSDGLTLTRDVNEVRWNGSALASALLSLSGTSTVFIDPDQSDLSAGSIGMGIAIRMGALLA
jgi:hypothetical protein